MLTFRDSYIVACATFICVVSTLVVTSCESNAWGTSLSLSYLCSIRIIRQVQVQTEHKGCIVALWKRPILLSWDITANVLVRQNIIVYLCKYFPRSRAFSLISADYRVYAQASRQDAALLLGHVLSLHTRAHIRRKIFTKIDYNTINHA